MATSYVRLLRRRQPLRELVPSSGERPSRRSWASGKNLSSCGRMLAGAETSAARSSSTSAALSELTHAYSRLLRRGQPLRELGLSSGERASHRSWASGNSLSSCGRMLAGAERGCGGCPPTNEHSSEVAMSAAACSGEDNLYGSWCLPPGNGSLTGVGLPVIIAPLAGEC